MKGSRQHGLGTLAHAEAAATAADRHAAGMTHIGWVDGDMQGRRHGIRERGEISHTHALLRISYREAKDA